MISVQVSVYTQAAGPVAAQLNVSWGSPATSIAVPLTATLPYPAQAIWTPAWLAFGTQAVGTASAPEQVTISDAPGSAFFDFGKLLQGGDADQFTITADNCLNTIVDPSTSCAVRIAFTPTTPGDMTASLTPFCMCGVGNLLSYTTLPLSGTGVAPTPQPPPTPTHRISGISLSSSTIRWCKGCAYPKTALRFRLTRSANVRVPLRAQSHGRWRQVAVATFHGHAGANRYQIAGRWRRQLLPARQVQLAIQIRQNKAWKTHKTLSLTVRSPYGTRILHQP